MEMYPPGAAGGFCAAVVKIEEFDTCTVIAKLIPDFVSDITTFCFVIFPQKSLQKQNQNRIFLVYIVRVLEVNQLPQNEKKNQKRKKQKVNQD